MQLPADGIAESRVSARIAAFFKKRQSSDVVAWIIPTEPVEPAYNESIQPMAHSVASNEFETSAAEAFVTNCGDEAWQKPYTRWFVCSTRQSPSIFTRKCSELDVEDRFEFDGFTLVYLKNPENDFEVELTVNHDHDQEEPYTHGTGYGHLAVSVADVDAEHMNGSAVLAIETDTGQGIPSRWRR